MLRLIIIFISVSFTNYWIYRIFQENTLLGILLVLESFIYSLSFFLKSKTVISLGFIILVFIGIFLLKNYFDKTVLLSTEMESIQKLRNHEYYARELGKVYKNKLGLLYFGELQPLFYRLEHKFFSFLDIRAYFGFDNNQNLYYPTFLFFFFIIGFIDLLKNLKMIPLTYTFLLLLLNTFISAKNDLGSILLFPLFNLFIALGFIKSLKTLLR